MLHYLKTIDGIEYYRFSPSLFKQYEACYSPEETPHYWKRPIHRVRMLIEYLKTNYNVIYMQSDGVTVGHLVVARGGLRLVVSTAADIVIGPIWVPPRCRNRGYASKGIAAVLHGLDIPYRHAYEFIDVNNAPSIATVQKNGFSLCFWAKEVGPLKRVVESEGGTWLVFRYPGDSPVSGTPSPSNEKS